MKIIISILTCLSLAFAGCSTLGKPDPGVVRAVAQEAGYIGTTFTLQTNPQYRPMFDAARLALQGFVDAGSGNVTNLNAILIGNLPVSGLGTNSGSMLLMGQGGIALYNATGTVIAKLDKGQLFSTYAQPIAQGLLAGMNQALGIPNL